MKRNEIQNEIQNLTDDGKTLVVYHTLQKEVTILVNGENVARIDVDDVVAINGKIQLIKDGKIFVYFSNAELRVIGGLFNLKKFDLIKG